MAMIQDGVLALLARGPSHGYALWQTLRSWAAEPESVQGGSVYAALRRLEKAGALEEVLDTAPQSARDRPMRINFVLTDDGRARYERWREEPPTSAEDVRLRLALVTPTDDLQPLIRWVQEALTSTQRQLGELSSEHRRPARIDSWETAAELALARVTFREVSAKVQWLAEVHGQLQMLGNMAKSDPPAR
jgi:DNA-binding PadR family transcriptional regulator